MKIFGEDKRALWFDRNVLYMYDQRKLPGILELFEAKTVDDVDRAIRDMVIRGAPAIGAAAVYGMVIGQKDIKRTADQLRKTRPTAYDLFYAIDYMMNAYNENKDLVAAADAYVEDIIDRCKRIGEHGDTLLEEGMRILTHCNAGALATVDYGTALAPLRIAKQSGKNIFVFADETRPRLQGLLTSWELEQEGITHAVIADNAAGYYMRNGEIDLVITGADRIAKNGDFANKIGTYEKAVLAKENGIPFYVAAPISTFDKTIASGKEIVIEQRADDELKTYNKCRIMRDEVPVKNPAFDVTPHKYVNGYITEEGIKTL